MSILICSEEDCNPLESSLHCLVYADCFIVPASLTMLSVLAVGVPDSLPYLPLDEQFNETKTFGFVGNEITAALAEVSRLCHTNTADCCDASVSKSA